MAYSQSSLTAYAGQFMCCAGQVGYSLYQCLLSNPSKIGDYNKLLYLTQVIDSIENYLPIGSVLIPGEVASLQLDFSGVAVPGSYYGFIYFDGTLISVISYNTYTTVDELVDEVESLINASGLGYTATNDGSGLLSVFAPASGNSYNTVEINIQLNPSFSGSGSSLSDISGRALVVNNPNSAFYGKTFIGFTDAVDYYIRVYTNGIEEAISPIQVTQPLPINPGRLATNVLEYDEYNDRIYITGVNYGRYSYLDSNYQIYTPGSGSELYIISSPAILTNNTYRNSAYNPFNNSTYFVSTNNSEIRRVDELGVMSILSGVADPYDIEVDPTTGNVWVSGSSDVGVFDYQDNLVYLVPPNTPGTSPRTITYYDGGGIIGAERMYISYRDTTTSANGFISIFRLDSTLITPLFYSVDILEYFNSIYYSDNFNLLFINNRVGGSGFIDIVALDGTLITQIPTTYKNYNFQIVEDEKHVRIIQNGSNVSKSGTSSWLVFIDPLMDGVEVSAVFSEGVNPVLSTADDNCLTEAELKALIMNSQGICCCVDYNNISTTVASSTTETMYRIYYGNVIAAPVLESEILALGDKNITSFEDTYSFLATTPSEYKCIAIPAVLGAPSKFVDNDTTFEIPMQPTYQIIVNSIIYDVYLTYYQLGGAITIDVQS